MDSINLGEGVYFERIRRITGYLVGDYRRMNNAKQKEVEDRVKHDKNSSDSDNISNIDDSDR